MKSLDAAVGGYCGCILLVLLFNILLGGVTTQYVAQFWGGYFTHQAVTIPFFVCALVGLVLGELTIPLAAITWLLSFIIHAPGY